MIQSSKPSPTDPGRPRVIELFAGAGGLSLGFEQAGFDLAAAVEIDPVHCAIHELNFPQTRVFCRSVAELSGADILGPLGMQRGEVEVVTGGPPCQGFSMIGQRVLEDPRNSLVFHFLRLVDEIRPRLFLMENVPGLATGAHHQLLDELIEKAEAAGYRVVQPYQILNAADFGVPQDRRRIFLLGARRDVRMPEYPAPTHNPSREGARVRAAVLADWALPPTPTVWDALSDLPDIDDHADLLETDQLQVTLCGGSPYARALRGDLVDPTDYSYPRACDARLLTGCLRAEHTEESRRRFRATTPGSVEPISRFLRLAKDGLCNTLRAGTNTDRGAYTAPRPIHPVHARCISVREAARLHSYPDWFRFHRSIWHGFREIGNSVPPMLGRAVAGQLLAALDRRPNKPLEPVPLGAASLSALTLRAAAAHFGVSSGVIARRTRAPGTGAKGSSSGARRG